jgi:hypothetical protein
LNKKKIALIAGAAILVVAVLFIIGLSDMAKTRRMHQGAIDAADGVVDFMEGVKNADSIFKP